MRPAPRCGSHRSECAAVEPYELLRSRRRRINPSTSNAAPISALPSSEIPVKGSVWAVASVATPAVPGILLRRLCRRFRRGRILLIGRRLGDVECHPVVDHDLPDHRIRRRCAGGGIGEAANRGKHAQDQTGHGPREGEARPSGGTLHRTSRPKSSGEVANELIARLRSLGSEQRLRIKLPARETFEGSTFSFLPV